MKPSDTNYWNQYYKRNAHPQDPSSFAVYVQSAYLQGAEAAGRLVELGCGNGRDAVYFARSCPNLTIQAFDLADEEIAFLDSNYGGSNLSFLNSDFSNLPDGEPFDIVYSRFTFHSIDELAEDRTLSWIAQNLSPGGKFFLEVRSSRDAGLEKAIKQAHYRRYLAYEETCGKVDRLGLRILERVESQGLAVYKNEDPFIIRIVAELPR